MSRTGRLLVAGGLVAVGLLWAVRAWSSNRLPVAAPLMVTEAYHMRPDTVHRNETLSDVFARHDITGTDLLNLLKAAGELDPRRVRPNTVFTFRYAVGGDDRPEAVRVRLNRDVILHLRRDGDDWSARNEDIAWTVYTERVDGRIEASLDQAMDRTISDSVLPFSQRRYLVTELAEQIFPWVIDFSRDIYEGDHFDVLYERLVSSQGEVKFGRILAARIESRGRPAFAYLMPDEHGNNAYYDESGRSLRRAFLMAPVDFRRISSRFNMARLHPILGTRRPHLGVDFAADIGTPIKATGDGTVIRANRWGGYGNVVVIRHAKGIETRYAHMRGFAPGIHSGVRVTQGQTIGYVGMTGLANGPHVHYEFLQHGRHVNPRAVDLGDGDPVPASRRAEFDSLKTEYDRYFPKSNTAQSVD